MTEIGEVPESWQMQRIGELCNLSNGNGFRPADWSQSGLPIIRIQNLNGSQDFNYFNGIPKPEWLVETGQLLFAWAGVKGVSFGPRMWTGPQGVLNQHIFRVTPNSGVDIQWLNATLRLVTSDIESRAHGFKSSLLHVRKGEITERIVAVPPLTEQAAIAEYLDAVSQVNRCNTDELTRLAASKTGIMDALLTNAN